MIKDKYINQKSMNVIIEMSALNEIIFISFRA